MPDWVNYRYGIQQVSDNVYAYLMPDGSWSLTNTAVVVNGGDNLLIDTLVDIPMTRRMLAEMAAAAPSTQRIQTVLLTHWHIDHVHGICVDELRDSRVIASQACADYMARLPPDRWLANVAALAGDARKMMDALIGTRFDFTGLTYRAPSETFTGRTQLRVGALDIVVEEMKPCHTLSDSVVFIKQDGVVLIGDLYYAGRHLGLQYPFMRNLIAAFETLAGWDADIFISGHGPIMNKRDLGDVLDYLRFLQTEIRARYDRGLSSDAAAEDLLGHLGPYKSLRHPQSLYFTAAMLYSEFGGDTDDYLRRNYSAYLAKQWRLRHSVPERFPELFAGTGPIAGPNTGPGPGH